MRIQLERRLASQLATRRVNESEEAIVLAGREAQAGAAARAAAERARLSDAGTCINASVRGFLGRVKARMARKRRGAAVAMQKRIRGIYGRRKADEARWRQASVVKSKFALRKMRFRSKVTMRKGLWVEMMDPETRSLWYLHEKSSRTTWEPPEEVRRQHSRRPACEPPPAALSSKTRTLTPPPTAAQLRHDVGVREKLLAKAKLLEEELSGLVEDVDDEVSKANRIAGPRHKLAARADELARLQLAKRAADADAVSPAVAAAAAAAALSEARGDGAARPGGDADQPGGPRQSEQFAGGRAGRAQPGIDDGGSITSLAASLDDGSSVNTKKMGPVEPVDVEEVIRRLYPVKVGRKKRVFESGCSLDGWYVTAPLLLSTTTTATTSTPARCCSSFSYCLCATPAP